MPHHAPSLPPLTFDDPALNDPGPAEMPLRASLPTLTFGPGTEAANDTAATASGAYHIPSLLPGLAPEAAPDPSFDFPSRHTAAAPMPEARASVAHAPRSSQSGPAKPAAFVAPPPPPPTLEARIVEVLEGIFDALPPWPDAMRREVPPAAVFVVALLALWFEVGFSVRSMRAFVRALSALSQ